MKSSSSTLGFQYLKLHEFVYLIQCSPIGQRKHSPDFAICYLAVQISVFHYLHLSFGQGNLTSLCPSKSFTAKPCHSFLDFLNTHIYSLNKVFQPGGQV